MATIDVMTEVSGGDMTEQVLADHLSAILRRVAAGADLVVTLRDGTEVELSPLRRPVGLAEFRTWPKADRKMLTDIREVIAETTTTDDGRNPWERWA